MSQVSELERLLAAKKVTELEMSKGKTQPSFTPSTTQPEDRSIGVPDERVAQLTHANTELEEHLAHALDQLSNLVEKHADESNMSEKQLAQAVEACERISKKGKAEVRALQDKGASDAIKLTQLELKLDTALMEAEGARQRSRAYAESARDSMNMQRNQSLELEDAQAEIAALHSSQATLQDLAWDDALTDPTDVSDNSDSMPRSDPWKEVDGDKDQQIEELKQKLSRSEAALGQLFDKGDKTDTETESTIMEALLLDCNDAQERAGMAEQALEEEKARAEEALKEERADRVREEELALQEMRRMEQVQTNAEKTIKELHSDLGATHLQLNELEAELVVLRAGKACDSPWDDM